MNQPLEIELKEIHERPFAFYVFIAITIHIALGYGIYYLITSPFGNGIRNAIADVNTKNSSDLNVSDPQNKTSENAESPNNLSGGQVMPPFESSSIISNRYLKETFVHEKSGLLFADEINMPEQKKDRIRKQVIEPKIHRDFSLENLPRQFRNKEWDLTLRLKVDRNGAPVGNIKVIKSSGDKVLDQLTINRVKESRFEPAHYEGTADYFDYTFDMEIRYR